MQAAAAWSSTSTPTEFIWYTTPSASTTYAEAMRLDENKNLNVKGNITADGNCCTSDIAKKERLAPISDAIKLIEGITGVQFTWKKNKKRDMGVIAQQVEAIAPELVTEKDGIKRVNYNGIIAILIESVKDLNRRLESLEAV